MAGNGRKRADGVLATAFAAGATVADAAAQAGVSERTVYRRLKDTAFCLQVRSTEEAIRARVLTRLIQESFPAVDTLSGLLLPDNPPFVRFAAAKQILEYTMRRQESGMQQRLSAVEEVLEGILAELRARAKQEHRGESHGSEPAERKGHCNGRGSHPARAIPEGLLARMGAVDPAVDPGVNGHTMT
jgi:AcrR family transcriptional regulator